MDKNTRIARGFSARFSLVGGVRGFLAAFGFASALASPAVAQQPPQRAAVLLPPRPLEAGELPPVARGAIDDVPSAFSTPVQKPTPRTSPATSAGPPWLNGVDPNVRPASGVGIGPKAPNPVAVKSTPAPTAPLPARPVVREVPARIVRTAEKPNVTVAPDHLPPTEPTGNPPLPNANTPFRASTMNGAPVYAGPPAYRWYGYGSVTPGANPFAPTGQYPKASANWYSVTGATPGAFPVPVMNPLRTPAGAEPPSYAAIPTTRNPGPMVVAPTLNAIPPANAIPVPPTIATKAPIGTKFESAPPTEAEPPRLGPPPKPSVPAIAPPLTAPVSTPAPPEMPIVPMPQPAPVAVPTIATPPVVGPIAPPPPQPVQLNPSAPVVGEVIPPPVALVPSLAPQSPEPLAPQMPAAPLVAPAPSNLKLPVFPPQNVPGDVRWQPGENPMLPEGTWTPSPGLMRKPNAGEPIARGQVADTPTQPDPLGDLIRALCKGRTSGVEVRWTGVKKVVVCFEATTQAEANKIVQDISARPELVPIQIDFCVLVK